MLQAYVSGVSYACCKHFYVDVAKVDQDVAYVAMAIRMLQVSVPNVSVVSDGCCTCFI
jgi:hypothetical protein